MMTEMRWGGERGRRTTWTGRRALDDSLAADERTRGSRREKSTRVEEEEESTRGPNPSRVGEVRLSC